MKRKVVMYREQVGFVMECGHFSPFFVSRNLNVKKTLRRFQSGTLYRDCPLCQKKETKVAK